MLHSVYTRNMIIVSKYMQLNNKNGKGVSVLNLLSTWHEDIGEWSCSCTILDYGTR
jgi:hypothetical protein